MTKITFIAALLFPGFVHAQMLTQTNSQTIMADNSVACVDFTLGIRENHFFRAFPLSGLGYSSYQVTGVDFGVEQAQSDLDDGIPVVVRLYSTSEVFPANFPASYTLLAEQSTSIIADNLYLLSTPISAVIDGESTLVVEIEIPETDGSFFQLGSNNLGQTAPGYIMAPTCLIESPIPLSSAGFPDMHAIINVMGTGALGLPQFEAAGLKMFPNPSTDRIMIEIPESMIAERFSVADLSGKIVIDNNSPQIDVSALADGIYIVKAFTSAGEFVTKLVKN